MFILKEIMTMTHSRVIFTQASDFMLGRQYIANLQWDPSQGKESKHMT